MAWSLHSGPFSLVLKFCQSLFSAEEPSLLPTLPSFRPGHGTSAGPGSGVQLVGCQGAQISGVLAAQAQGHALGAGGRTCLAMNGHRSIDAE